MTSPKTQKHIRDTDARKKIPSYQSKDERQNLRQSPDRNTHNFGRDDLGFTNRDTRGYDKQHKGKY